jgi:hypothetical protein
MFLAKSRKNLYLRKFTLRNARKDILTCSIYFMLFLKANFVLRIKF